MQPGIALVLMLYSLEPGSRNGNNRDMNSLKQPDHAIHESTRVTEETVSMSTNLGAGVFSLLAVALLVVRSVVAGKPWHIASFSIYGFSLVLMFMASALHHAVQSSPRVERALIVLDYSAVFLLIAGTMTPICLVVLRDSQGWHLLGVAWAVTLAGALLKALVRTPPRAIATVLYVTLGCLAVVVAAPISMNLGVDALIVLATGALLYSLGALVHALERPNPKPGVFGFHEIWHLLVMAGAAGHVVFMFQYVLPLH